MQILGKLNNIFIGKAEPFVKKGSDRAFESAIDKKVVSGSVNVNEMGIIGDEVGDKMVMCSLVYILVYVCGYAVHVCMHVLCMCVV